MNKNWIVVVALAGILVVPAVARAHEDTRTRSWAPCQVSKATT